MTTKSPKNKGQCSSVSPAEPKGKLRLIYTPRKRFPGNSDIECSAYPSGLLTYSIHPCTPSPLASRCQLALPTPSPLAHELTLRRRCAPPPPPEIYASAAATAARSTCPGDPTPSTPYAAAAFASTIPRRPRECRRRRRRS
jgi:hypothetical protein